MVKDLHQTNSKYEPREDILFEQPYNDSNRQYQSPSPLKVGEPSCSFATMTKLSSLHIFKFKPTLTTKSPCLR
jgi:hypothetical protein